MKSDDKLREYIEALAAEGHGGRDLEDLEADNIGKVGRMRIAQSRAIRDREAARLLPLGWFIVAERMGVCKATVYNMERRARKSKQVATG